MGTFIIFTLIASIGFVDDGKVSGGSSLFKHLVNAIHGEYPGPPYARACISGSQASHGMMISFE